IYVVHIVLKLVFGQSKKNTLNLSLKAKEKRLVLKTSFSLCFRTGTSALPTARWRAISKMPFKLRKNTMPRRNAPRQLLTIFLKVQIGGEGGIRTHGTLRHNGFQDRRLQPLSHLSNILRIVALLLVALLVYFITKSRCLL